MSKENSPIKAIAAMLAVASVVEAIKNKDKPQGEGLGIAGKLDELLTNLKKEGKTLTGEDGIPEPIKAIADMLGGTVVKATDLPEELKEMLRKEAQGQKVTESDDEGTCACGHCEGKKAVNFSPALIRIAQGVEAMTFASAIGAHSRMSDDELELSRQVIKDLRDMLKTLGKDIKDELKDRRFQEDLQDNATADERMADRQPEPTFYQEGEYQHQPEASKEPAQPEAPIDPNDSDKKQS